VLSLDRNGLRPARSLHALAMGAPPWGLGGGEKWGSETVWCPSRKPDQLKRVGSGPLAIVLAVDAGKRRLLKKLEVRKRLAARHPMALVPSNAAASAQPCKDAKSDGELDLLQQPDRLRATARISIWYRDMAGQARATYCMGD